MHCSIKNDKNLPKKIRDDVELCLVHQKIERLNIWDTRDYTNQQFLDNILNSIEIKNIINTVHAKHEAELKCRIQLSPDPNNEDYWSSQGFMDTQNYSAIVRNLDRVHSLQLRLSALDTLLASPIIDNSIPHVWSDLLTKLKYCICDKNVDIAHKSIRVHYKLISNNATSSESYINILKATILVFKNIKRLNIEKEIDIRSSVIDFNLKLINFVLRLQTHVIKNWAQLKDEEHVEIIKSYFQLVSCQLQEYFDSDLNEIKAVHWISCLDPEAQWFKNFMQVLGPRLLIFKYLKNNTSFLKYCIHDVLYNVQNFSDSRSSELGPIINRENFIFSSFAHSLAIVSELMVYEQGRNLFPLNLKSESISLSHLIHILLNGLNNEYMGSLQRNILLKRVVYIINLNVEIMQSNKSIIQNLFQPFNIHVVNKRNIAKTINHNMHILQIMGAFLKSNSFSIVLGVFDNFTSRRHNSRLKSNISVKNHSRNARRISLTDFPMSASSITDLNEHRDFIPSQILFEIADLFIRQYIVQNEHDIFTQNLLTHLLTLCCELSSNQKILLNTKIDFVKFMTRLCDFYKCTTNFRFYECLENRITVSKIIVLLCNTYEYINLILQDKGLLYEIVSNVFSPSSDKFWDDINSFKYILNVGNTFEGAQVICKHQRQIVNNFLLCVWNSEEDELSFLTGSQRLTSKCIGKFLKITYALSFCLKSLRLILLDDDKDTINQDNDKPVFLNDLCETALVFNDCASPETFLGLLTVQMFIANNADILLYFESVYKLKEELEQTLSLQTATIDECALMRRNILFRLRNVGCIDARVTEDVNTFNNMNIFTQNANSAFKRRLRGSNELQRFLLESRNSLHDKGWLIQVRKIFKTTCAEPYKPSLIFELVEQVAKAVPNKKHNYTWPTNDNCINKLFPEDYIGISAIVSFGIQNGLLQNVPQMEDNLRLLLMQSQIFLKRQCQDFENFDWFLGIIFLISAGNVDKSKTLLLNIFNFASVPILWYNYNKYVYKKSTNNIYNAHVNHINTVLMDFSKLISAFEIFKIPSIHLQERWYIQSFFNVLDFMEICNYIVLCILYPPEYAAYFYVCVLKHLQSKVQNAVNNEDAWQLLKLTQVDGFKTCNYLNNIEKLGKKYKNAYVKL